MHELGTCTNIGKNDMYMQIQTLRSVLPICTIAMGSQALGSKTLCFTMLLKCILAFFWCIVCKKKCAFGTEFFFFILIEGKSSNTAPPEPMAHHVGVAVQASAGHLHM